MKSYVVVTPRQLEKKQVREFVEAQGGYWNVEPTLDQGVVERDSSAVFVSVETEIQPYDYEASEVEELTEILGSTPRSLVCLHISHAEGSVELAEEVARLVVELWDGYLDRDG